MGIRKQHFLRYSEYTIAEIGERCGLEDAFSFSRMFKVAICLHQERPQKQRRKLRVSRIVRQGHRDAASQVDKVRDEGYNTIRFAVRRRVPTANKQKRRVLLWRTKHPSML